MADTSYRRLRMMVHWYTRLVAQHPYMVALTVLSVVTVCTTLAMVQRSPYNFILEIDPEMLFFAESFRSLRVMISLAKEIENYKNNKMLSSDSSFAFKALNQSAGRQTLGYQEELQEQERISTTPIAKHGEKWFCEDIAMVKNKNLLAPMVYFYRNTEYAASKSLFTLQAVQSMCAVENKYFGSAQFRQIRRSIGAGDKTKYCRSISLPNYLMLMYNRFTCNDIQEIDIVQTLELLQKCSRYYHTGQLEHNCATRLCLGVPEECSSYNAVFNLLHYILDRQFLPAHNLSQTNLQFVSSYIPVKDSTQLLFYLRSLTPPWGDKLISMQPPEQLYQFIISKQHIISDSRYLTTASIVLFIITHMYTGSLIITTAFYMAIFMALGQAYFVYRVILGIFFFPSFNLFATVIIVAFGIDESLVFSKIWNDYKYKEQSEEELNLVVLNALQRLLPFLLVYTLATSIPFFITATSRIEIIVSFSIFAGLTSLMYMLLMVTWTPAVAVLSKRFCNTKMRFSKLPFWFQFTDTFCKWHQTLLKKIFRMLNSFHRIWMTNFGVIALAALVYIICDWRQTLVYLLQSVVRPWLRIRQPSLQIYDNYIDDIGESTQNPGLWKMNIIWGVLVTDNFVWYERDPLQKIQTSIYDPEFNVSSPESQTWMYKFCQNLNIRTSANATCFMANVRHWMENRSCRDNVSNISHYPCCRESPYHFPYPSSVFQQCAAEAIRFGVHNGVIDDETDHIQAFYDQFDIQLENKTVKNIASFIEDSKRWMNEWLVSAPSGLRRGWLYMPSTLGFEIAALFVEEMHLAVYLGVLFPFMVVLMATMDPIISLFATINVFCIIVVTIALLKVISWHENVLSLYFFTAMIGLSADFTIHYSIEYRHCTATTDHKERVLHVLKSVGSPLALTALFTLIIGCFLLPSTVNMFFISGVYLVVVTVVNWCYSTLFFLSLLSIYGPQRSCWNKFGWSRILQLLKGTASSPQIALDVIVPPHEAAVSVEQVSADVSQWIEDISQEAASEQTLSELEQTQATATDDLEQVAVTDKQQLVPNI